MKKILCVFLLLGSSALWGIEQEEAALGLQNPLADLTSVPLQINYDQDIGPNKSGERWLTNIQPVVPISINQDWLLITRTILPLISQSDVVPGYGTKSGNGDILESLFFSPRQKTASGWTWGVGPVFSIPIASRDEFGTEKWSIGPTGVVLRQSGSWTYGMLINHLVSFAGDSSRSEVNATFAQPFVSHVWSKGTSLALTSEYLYDWKSDQSNFPVNLIAGQVLPIAGQLFSFNAGIRYWFNSVDNGPEGFGGRFVVTWIIPTT